MSNENVTMHTSPLLRKHGMLVRQTGWGDDAKFAYVDWQTYRRVSKVRREAFEDEDTKVSA